MATTTWPDAFGQHFAGAKATRGSKDPTMTQAESSSAASSSTGEASAGGEASDRSQGTTHIVLFYKYHPLSSDKALTERYRLALEQLCSSLDLRGRILVGCSDDGEGINGTLAGSYANVRAFTYALLGKEYYTRVQCDEPLSTEHQSDQSTILNRFWQDCQAFADAANVPVLTMSSPEDFKWSKSTLPHTELFPDLFIKLVKEMISTGGAFSGIRIDDTSKGYLTPQQWHEEMQRLNDPANLNKRNDSSSNTNNSNGNNEGDNRPSNNTVVIDVRNAKECAIGRFDNAVDPKTSTFSQFPHWVQKNKESLHNKRVLMYCTGGIRCEKASAYIRKAVPEVQQVQHLRGGIHKYLEAYGEKGLWKGKNFVFDGRGSATAAETKLGKDHQGGVADGTNDVTTNDTSTNRSTTSTTTTTAFAGNTVVGSCQYCQKPYDTFHADRVCTVCRELVLACDKCRPQHVEFHCEDHFHLRDCYFTNLCPFSECQLQNQLSGLQQQLSLIAIGRKFKRKRATLHKQIEKVELQLRKFREGSQNDPDRNDNKDSNTASTSTEHHRNDAATRKGACAGFRGLERKRKLDHTSVVNGCGDNTGGDGGGGDGDGLPQVDGRTDRRTEGPPPTRKARKSASQRVSKQQQRLYDAEEIRALKLAKPCRVYRDEDTGVRVPPPTTRIIKTSVKGEWC